MSGSSGAGCCPSPRSSFDRMPDGSWPIVSYAAKWHPGEPGGRGHPAGLPGAGCRPSSQRRIGTVARHAWDYVAGGEGYGRVDLRVDEQGQPWVLEVNPCPDLSSDAGLARMGRAAAGTTTSWCMHVVDEALDAGPERAAPPPPRQRGVRARERHAHRPRRCRHLTPADRGRIEEITRAVRVFRRRRGARSPSRCSTPPWPAPPTTPRSARSWTGGSSAGSAGAPRPAPSGTYDLLLDRGRSRGARRGDRLTLLREMERPAGRVCAADRRRDGRATRLPAHAGLLRAPRVPPRGRHPGLLCPGRRSGRLREVAGVTAPG